MFEKAEETLEKWGKKLQEDWLHRRGFLVAAIVFVTLFNLGIPIVLIYLIVVHRSFGEFLVSFCPEIFGIAFTVFVLNRLAERRQEKADKQRLTEELGSQVKDVAVYAAEKLRRRGWLTDGSLQGAHLGGAKFDKDTILPDGNNWTPGTDMDRFTDPDHPDFWRSSVPPSPAYRGDAPAG